jgi:hypothetical protein
MVCRVRGFTLGPRGATYFCARSSERHRDRRQPGVAE